MSPEPARSTGGSSRRSRVPAWALLLLAPAIGELLSGSSPPAEFFTPFTFALQVALYGSGAVLARELTCLWRKGWPTLLTLGVAYAIIEEGLCCKSFFDPHWPDAGVLGSYGRWLGVNWIWAVLLTGYHAVFSILVPVALVELAFPAHRGESWAGPRFRWVLLGLLLTVVVLGLLLFPDAAKPYRPPVVGYALTVVLVIALIGLAARLPAAISLRPAKGNPGRDDTSPPETPAKAPSRPIAFGVTAFLGTLGWFGVFWGLPHTALPPLGTLAFGLIVVGVVAGVLGRLAGGDLSRLEPRHRWALCTGCLLFFILLAPIQEAANAQRPDNTAGMTVVGLAFALGLIWLRYRLRSGRRQPEPRREACEAGYPRLPGPPPAQTGTGG